MIPAADIARMKDRVRLFGHIPRWSGDTGMLAQDVDRLIAEVERLQAKVAELEVELSRWHERGRPITER